MAMHKTFERLKKALEESDKKNEKLILLSRKVISESKHAIYSLMAGKKQEAEKHIKQMKKEFENMCSLVKSDRSLAESGSFKSASQEYCEAVLFYEFVGNKQISGHEELGLEAEYYILGLCDLTGELFRQAINSAIRGNYAEMERIRDFVTMVYAELTNLHLKNGEVRRKFDSIKYDLKKLDEALLHAKTFGKC